MATKNKNLHTVKTQGTYYDIVKKNISKIVIDYQRSEPGKKLFMMGWGNTSQPLSPAITHALVNASKRLGDVETYTSYEDIRGNVQLREKICEEYYSKKIEVSFDPSEVFVNDGAQSILTNILELFEPNNTVALPNPYYPSFYEGVILSGRSSFLELPCLEENHFIPEPPQTKVDLIYLCSPNNPTGAVFNRKQLQAFVNYARYHGSILIFDAVYNYFIRTPDVPMSIYEIEGARECAIEVCSFSKFASFTGLRVGWSIVPDTLLSNDSEYGELKNMWNIRNSIKFWGASNLAQQAAMAILTEQGQKECKGIVDYYMGNACLLKQSMKNFGFCCFGGTENPYLWVKAPNGENSWQFFHRLLTETGIVGIPGILFGSNGDGFIRLSTLGRREEIEEAAKNLEKFHV